MYEKGRRPVYNTRVRSSIMEEILVLTHLDWWKKANIPVYRKCWVFFILWKYALRIFHVYMKTSKSWVRHWSRLWKLAPSNINSTLKWHDMDTIWIQYMAIPHQLFFMYILKRTIQTEVLSILSLKIQRLMFCIISTNRNILLNLLAIFMT